MKQKGKAEEIDGQTERETAVAMTNLAKGKREDGGGTWEKPRRPGKFTEEQT